MGFHNDLFPENISYGSRGGPGFSTSIVELDSGIEERITRWNGAKRTYDIGYGIRDHDDVAAVLKHLIARDGPANSFPFKDWTDYATTSNHRCDENGNDVANDDQVIGTGDGTTTIFQCIKTYTSGGISRQRKIVLPRSDTFLLALDGVAQSSGFTLNDTTGEITFSTAPGSGVEITAGFEFDTVVRYGAEVDSGALISLDNFDSDSISLSAVEVIDEGFLADEFFFGGAKVHGVVTEDFTISLVEGRVHSFENNTSGVKAILPTISDIPAGGPIFYLHNTGSQSTSVEDKAGSAVVTVTSGNVVELLVTFNSSGSKIWISR